MVGNLEFKHSCKPQMQLGKGTDNVLSVVSSTNKGTKGIMLANFALNFFLSSILSLLWGMINGMQIIALLPLANCDMPGNAHFLFNQIYTISTFNIINVDRITNYMSSLFGLDKTST